MTLPAAAMVTDKLLRPAQSVRVAACGEIPLKVWLIEEAQRCGVSFRTLERRYYRGYYEGLKRRVERRAVFVEPSNHQQTQERKQ